MCVIRSIERSIYSPCRSRRASSSLLSVDSRSKVRLSCRQYAHLQGKWKISPSANTHTRTHTNTQWLEWLYPPLEGRNVAQSDDIAVRAFAQKRVKKNNGDGESRDSCFEKHRVKITVVRKPEIKIPEKLNFLWTILCALVPKERSGKNSSFSLSRV